MDTFLTELESTFDSFDARLTECVTSIIELLEEEKRTENTDNAA